MSHTHTPQRKWQVLQSQSGSRSVTLLKHKTTPHSGMKIKFITVTVFSNPPRPCSATERITIIQTLPLPPSALRYKAAHPVSSLDCRQHSILWTPASSPSVRSIGTDG